MAKRRTYHHGDLRNALIASALALIDEHGADSLTLRSIAAAAGVSHGAPAHHFADLRAVLTSVAARGFDRLAVALADAHADADDDPESALRAVADAYVAFALKTPGLFALMFAPGRLNADDAEFRKSAREAYGELERAAARASAAGAAPGFSATDLEYLIWSSAHGYAHLALARLVPKPGAAFKRTAPNVAGMVFAMRGPVSRRRGPT